MYCNHCGHDLMEGENFCPSCGEKVEGPGPGGQEIPTRPVEPGFHQSFQQTQSMGTPFQQESYGQGAPSFLDYRKQLPGRFNWGAFSMPLIWGIGNNCYITLLALIPLANIIMSFLAGFKGNQWALENNTYRDMEEFSKIQGTWNKAGFIFFIVQVVVLILGSFFWLSMVVGLLNLMDTSY